MSTIGSILIKKADARMGASTNIIIRETRLTDETLINIAKLVLIESCTIEVSALSLETEKINFVKHLLKSPVFFSSKK